VGSANLGLTLREAEWKDAPAITLKILEQIDTLSRLVDRPIPIALSLVIKAANFGLTLCAQFRDAGELTGGLKVMGATTTCLTFQELQEKLQALSAGGA
ncbi:MAG TPA: hypothetical protein VN203_19490, partial [Candidatus Acidoferrum sp.]|nr:hypothetical protein [Candidatus Acidoferrum sp.]